MINKFGLVLSFFISVSIGYSQMLPETVPTFVEKYCLECHDSDVAKGDRSFELFLDDPTSKSQHLALEEILDQLNLGEMPPKKKSVQQPADEERQTVVDAITAYLSDLEATSKSATTLMRRLTRYEYNYTMRDLLGVDTATADATGLFPVDPRHHGFSNLGTVQSLSEHQLNLYIQAARKYLDLSLVLGEQKPETQKWIIPASELNGKEKEVGTITYHIWAPDRSYMDIGHGQPVERSPTYSKQFARKGVPVSGNYRIKVKATAVGREHPYGDKLMDVDLNEPLQIGIWHVPNSRLLNKGASEGRVHVASIDLPDNDIKEFEVTSWMPAGSIPFVNWINGPGSSKGIMERVIQEFYPEADRKTQTKVDQLIEQGLPVPKDALVQKIFISDLYKGPRVRVYEISIEGPILDQWPPAGHRNVIGETTELRKIDISKVYTDFASKAYRRPVDRSEVDHFVNYSRSQMAEKKLSKAHVIKEGLSAILTSPRFLYLDEGGESLDQYQLATRLSYALWSSMPDARLRELADQGELTEPDVWTKQIDRLLDDPRSTAFVKHFTNAWLQLYKIGTMPPGPKQFKAYYANQLEPAMKTETRMLFAEILRQNLPLTDFLTADYTYLNSGLARHYNIPEVKGSKFRRVNLPTNSPRRGLLGHASILTATANGVETSPVVRGVWVMEAILGTPPSPPPPDVPPIEPDTRGATTIREQLAKHRNVAACADCHAKIDPWGFALEYYDPIGGYRKHYPMVYKNGINYNRKGKPVDGSSELPSGEMLQNDSDLREVLLARKDQFTQTLIDKLLTYTTGRETSFRDKAEIKQLASEAEKNEYKFRDLVHAVLGSSAFTR